MAADKTKLEKILAFAKAHPVAVLATASKTGEPHAAAVFVVTDSAANFYFITKEATTKHKNLTSNDQAALALYDARSQTTLQAAGIADRVTDPELFREFFEKIDAISAQISSGKRTPISKLYAGNYFLYKLMPRSLRLAEYMNPDSANFHIFSSR